MNPFSLWNLLFIPPGCFTGLFHRASISACQNFRMSAFAFRLPRRADGMKPRTVPFMTPLGTTEKISWFPGFLMELFWLRFGRAALRAPRVQDKRKSAPVCFRRALHVRLGIFYGFS